MRAAAYHIQDVLDKFKNLKQFSGQGMNPLLIIELQGKIAAAEAEKLVFEQCEAEEIHLNQVYQEQVKPPSVYSRHSSKASADNVIPVHHKAPLKLDKVRSKVEKKTAVKQQLNPSVSQWLPNQHPTPHQYDTRAYGYQLEHLMETHDRQNIALQQIVQQQQQSVMALTLPRCLERVILSNVQLSSWKFSIWTIKIESSYQMYTQRQIYRSALNVLASKKTWNDGHILQEYLYRISMLKLAF